MGCGVSLRQELFFVRDLLLQCGHVLLQVLHLLFESTLVLFENEQALGCCRVTLAAQVGEVDHLRERHPRFPQVDEQADPVDVPLCVPTMSARCPAHGCEQPDALVVAQGINAQPRLLGDLMDR